MKSLLCAALISSLTLTLSGCGIPVETGTIYSAPPIYGPSSGTVYNVGGGPSSGTNYSGSGTTYNVGGSSSGTNYNVN